VRPAHDGRAPRLQPFGKLSGKQLDASATGGDGRMRFVSAGTMGSEGPPGRVVAEAEFGLRHPCSAWMRTPVPRRHSRLVLLFRQFRDHPVENGEVLFPGGIVRGEYCQVRRDCLALPQSVELLRIVAGSPVHPREPRKAPHEIALPESIAGIGFRQPFGNGETVGKGFQRAGEIALPVTMPYRKIWATVCRSRFAISTAPRFSTRTMADTPIRQVIPFPVD
jgi:hypothetical protein